MRNILVMSTMVLLGLAGFAADEKSEHKAGDIMSVDIGGGVKMDFVWCPPGEFMMGSEKGEKWEKPVHRVRIAQGFWLGKCEVTKAQWKAVMGTEPWKGQEKVFDDPDSPAVYVSWDDTQALCQKMGSGFRLPSEAEWEYACRAGITGEYCFGDDKTHGHVLLRDYAWHGKNAGEFGEAYAHRVGLKKPNDWGLCDMHGNVYEWCQDWYRNNYEDAPTDGGAWELPAGERRVLRGGSWDGNWYSCCAATRLGDAPIERSREFGLRLVRTP